jgi:hemoglobin
MQTGFEAAGGNDGLSRLADAWHRRVMADDVVAHAFSHGFHPQHVDRLAAYWAEALGGPTTYSDFYGDETTVVKMHSGNGEHDEMDRRAIACFDQAMADVGLASDGALRQVLHDYFAWRPRQQCPATTSPAMMCRTASASHTGHGTDSRCKTPRLTTGIGPNFEPSY